ncbi:Transcriptional regulator [Streptomyces clavuligerus]|uniref:Transcriptional regulator n=2 Tax=Streptomyces clavuligerus TaxID=1901 RepID=E2Q096_STRCL|nr:Transcriptional regulator [Streptomyces clavuligerus]
MQESKTSDEIAKQISRNPENPARQGSESADSAMLDHIDVNILHALQRAPRAAFKSIGEAVGVSEQTAARRFHALRRSGAMNVVGLVDPAITGQVQWVARVRCRPDRVLPLAQSLVRQPEVAYAHLSTGGTEIVCAIRSPLDSGRSPFLLDRMHSSTAVLDVQVDMMLHTFGGLGTNWTGHGGELGEEQIRGLTAGRRPRAAGAPALPDEDDAPLLEALAGDGRLSHTRLAQLTGWSKARVARRLEVLEESGALFYDVELIPERLGFHVTATLWLSVAPEFLHHAGADIATHPQVAFTGAITGDNNLMAVVICRDTEDLYRYLTHHLAKIPGISRHSVSLRSRSLKRSASLISHGRFVLAD